MISTLRCLGSSLAVVLFCALPLTARAEEPPSPWGQPVYYWGVQGSDGSLDSGLTAAVRQRLIEGGMAVLALPESIAAIQCKAAECPVQLKAAGAMTGGRILGAYLQGPVHDGAETQRQARVFWLDKATGKLLERSVSCQGCALSELLAREAVFLIEQASSSSTSAAATCSSPPPPEAERAAAFAESTAKGPLSGPISLSLTTTLGAKLPAKNLSTDLQNALLQMGVHTASASTSTGTRLTVELQGSTDRHKHSSAISSVFLSLSGSGLSRQLRLYCSPESCGRELIRFLRVNISALLDGAEPELAYAPSVAAIGCKAPLPGGIIVAAAGPNPVQVAEVAPPAPPAPSAPPIGVSPPDPKPDNHRALCIAGGTLLGVGLAGMVTSAVLLSQNGSNIGGTCDFYGLSTSCGLNSTEGSAIGIAFSGLSIIAGAVMVGYSYRRAPAKKGSPCQQ